MLSKEKLYKRNILSGRYCLNTEPKEQRPGNSQVKGPLNYYTLENEHIALPKVQAQAKLSGSNDRGVNRGKYFVYSIKRSFFK